jgi:hypothetical protein
MKRVAVEPAEAARAQEMSDLVAAQPQLGIGHGVAACRHDKSRLLAAGFWLAHPDT